MLNIITKIYLSQYKYLAVFLFKCIFLEEEKSLNEEEKSLNEEEKSLNEEEKSLNEEEKSLNEEEKSLNRGLKPAWLSVFF
ncbi:TPA: hypothetical protein TVG89_001941, partial [Streptococcus equi subsp. zooepidemicus]|nr:hypothetical protein [Streptococcus equi subsp. zooepidemicus]